MLSAILDDIRRGTRNGEEIAREECRRRYSEVLGVADATSPDEVKAAYRRLVGLWHPDRLDGMAPELRLVATEKMKEINEAYSWLSLCVDGDTFQNERNSAQARNSSFRPGIEVVMPEMGESISEGTLTKWLKNIGDVVQEGESLFEISTDKVDAEIPSPVKGTLSQVLVQEGQTALIDAVVAIIDINTVELEEHAA